MCSLSHFATARARSWQVYGFAAVVGLLAYLVVYGPGHLLGTDAYWDTPIPDERMAMMGYRYFLHEPWHWPVFVSHAINVPYAKSVAFLDCIPLWALVNKSFATIVPPWGDVSARTYLGTWHALAYVLQPCLGVAILRALGHRSWYAAAVGTAFFLAVPTWIFRYSHPALSAHWIELWALYLYLRTEPGRATPRSISLAKVAQLLVAALVSPYHVALSLPLFVISIARSRDRRTIAMWLPLGIAAAIVATWFAGYFAHETVRRQWGFEFESANMLSWLIPVRSGIIGDAQWIARIDGTPWQYEGYAYLGLGVLVLLGALAWHARELQPVIARHTALVVVVIASAAFALSNHVYFGSHEVLSFPIPRFLEWIPGQFRSPGRFVWLPTYVLIAFVVSWALARFTTGWRSVLVGCAAVVQLVDASGEWSGQRATIRPGPQLVDFSTWRPLIYAHDAVFVLPTYSCVIGDDGPELDAISRDIQWLASERAIPINGTYSARAMRRCAAEEREWSVMELQPKTLYVLLPRAAGVAERLRALGATCAAFDHGRVCSTDGAAIDDAVRAGALRF